MDYWSDEKVSIRRRYKHQPQVRPNYQYLELLRSFFQALDLRSMVLGPPLTSLRLNRLVMKWGRLVWKAQESRYKTIINDLAIPTGKTDKRSTASRNIRHFTHVEVVREPWWRTLQLIDVTNFLNCHISQIHVKTRILQDHHNTHFFRRPKDTIRKRHQHSKMSYRSRE